MTSSHVKLRRTSRIPIEIRLAIQWGNQDVVGWPGAIVSNYLLLRKLH
jgi:hypothetical protein